MMRKLLILSFIAALTSCSKDESSSPATTTGNGTSISSVPTTFTQKVLIETFTGAGQSQCTDGFVKLDNILSANTAKAIPVAIHYSDAMEINQYTTLQNTFANGSAPQFPSGMINRTPSLGMVIFNRTQWQSNFDVNKVKTAACGISIKSSINGTQGSAEVHCGFNTTLTGNYNVTTYLVEDNISGTGTMYDQRNGYNTTAGHPYYNLGDPILNFSHKYVLRKVVSAELGDAISSANIKAGGEEIKTYNFSTAGINTSNLYIVSFITKNGSTYSDKAVMNVQRVKIGNTQSWD
ncbi:MAG: Omp28-related outer membrane protein [Bacteroidota bacterium]